MRAPTWGFVGATVASTILVGALAVGDSVRGSLREFALQRLGHINFALATGDRFFREQLAEDLQTPLKVPVAPVLQLLGTASRSDGEARANRVQVLESMTDFGLVVCRLRAMRSARMIFG